MEATRPKSIDLAGAARILLAARRVVALCHVHPDGDAVGSLLGLTWLLRTLPRPPSITMVCSDELPLELRFLPGTSTIQREPPEANWDVIVALDASDPARLGTPFQMLVSGAAPLLVIDHHVTNLNFGTYNLVDVSAVATAQVIEQLAGHLGVPLDAQIATCLLTGLVTDTLGFRTSNVSAAALEAAVRMVQAGADLADIAQRTLVEKPLAVIRLWGRAFGQLKLEGGVLSTIVTRAMRLQAGLDGDDDGGLVSQLISVAEAQVSVVFNELADRRVEVDLRARPGFDVAAVALALGGGGHPQAAGCIMTGTVEQVEATVLPLLQDVARGEP